jgi:hypothetical protein
MGFRDYFEIKNATNDREVDQTIYLTQKTAPTLSLVTSAEAKNFAKVNYTADDGLISDIVKSAHFFVESQIHKCLCQQTWIQKQQGGCNKIKLVKCPIIGSPTVTIYEDFDSTGEALTINTDFRIVDNVLFSVDSFFTKYREGDGYSIEYDCGMYTSSNYTSSNDNERTVIKNVILRMAAFLYENRQIYCSNFNEENWSINYSYADLPVEIKHLLNPIRQSNLGLL